MYKAWRAGSVGGPQPPRRPAPRTPTRGWFGERIFDVVMRQNDEIR
ncbi:hypothetical protein SGL43_02448 [Streptomyces globisporus]|uniref:Uncharacterized protein n=1 Tax=Streptomyces globisporus TaxID=1908 RepID=A0ABN8UYN0_STRGL|nr:hypothetical protein SGL43_02448 [Streptomyces globisporus]